MTKLNRKYAVTLAILLVVAVAPASVAFAQSASVEGDSTTNATVGNNKIKSDANIRANINAKLDDKLEKRIANIKDKIENKLDKRIENVKEKKNTTSDMFSRNGTQLTDLTFRGQTDGWAIVGGVASKSSITLDGDAHNAGKGNWKINATGTLTIGDRSANLDLTGFARANKIHLQGTGTLSSGEPIRLVINGHFAPTSDHDVFAIAFTNAGVQYMNNGIRVPLMQVGSATVNTTVTTTAQQ